jgi:nucleoside phosphorylase
MEELFMQAPIDFVIITPLEEEREAMWLHLGKPKRLPPSEEDIRVYYPALVPFTFTDGTSGHYKVVLTDLLEMGRVDAATAVGDAVRRWRTKYVLLVGIAGGLSRAGVKVGDVLISEQIADYELQKLTPDKSEIRWKVYSPAARLLMAARQLRPDDWQPLVREQRPDEGKPLRHSGPMCTGDKVIANGLMKEYQDVWTKLIGVEMEAGGAAKAALQAAGAPGFFMVRGVSDLADPDKDKPQTRSWRAYACDVAAAYIEAFLKSGPVRPQADSSESSGLLPMSPSNTLTSGFPSLEVKTGECVLVRMNLTSDPISLPWELPMMSRRFGLRTAQNARHWKRVHTLSERLYGAFRRAHTQMVRYSYKGNETEMFGASQLLESAISEFRAFYEKIEKLPKTVYQAEHFAALRRSEATFAPLRRILTTARSSAEFNEKIATATTVIDLICTWSFDTLTRADRILENYFSGTKPKK